MRSMAAAGDVVVVVVFILIGRSNHDEAASLTGFAGTVWPFLAALALGWLLARAWREPLVLRTGAVVWVVTVAGGMLLRAASGQGTAVAFVVVATVFLGVALLGWRGVAGLLARRSAGRSARRTTTTV